MFWEIYQTGRINAATRTAGQAKLKSEQTLQHIARLESKIETLALACQSLWELLRENSELTESDLESRMEAIDIRDGRLDGKLSKVADACVKCGRRTSRRRASCLYCGAPNESTEVFGRS